MVAPRKKSSGKNLADEIAKRRGRRYPAHAFIAEHFPDYMEVLLDLDYVIRQKPRRFNEKMHELFHIIALAVEMSNPPNQPHLKQHLKKALLMGWKPAETFETGIRKTVQWYLDNQDWVNNVLSGDYRQWLERNYADRGVGEKDE